MPAGTLASNQAVVDLANQLLLLQLPFTWWYTECHAIHQ